MKKRILLLIKGLGPGGAERLLLSAAPYLDRGRFEYRAAYLLPEKDDLVKPLSEAGIETTCLGADLLWPMRLRRLVRRESIDLVHSHLPYTGIGARLAVLTVPLAYTEHNEWECYRPPTYWANLLTIGACDHVFAVSRHVRDSMRRPYWLPLHQVQRVEVLYHGIDMGEVAGWEAQDGVRAELGIPEGVPVVGTVANFRAEKALDILVSSVARMLVEVPDMRLVLVGQGALEPQLRRQVLASGIQDSVIFTGFREDAPRIVTAFDVFALSSVHEGLSIALIEAMAVGKPVVVTDAGGVSEVVRDGVEGLVVPSRRPDRLADALLSILEDSRRRDEMSRHARVRAFDFDIRTAVGRIETVYGELLA
jgi:glycosyltransferase involved in cell wall biosynthesis